MSVDRARLGAGAALLLLGLLLPRTPLASLLSELPVAERPAALALLAACVACNGLVLLLLARFGRALEGPGLPANLIGLPASPERRLGLWPVAAVVALGAALRLPGLTGDLWIDEIATLANYLRLPISKIVQTYTSANQHLLYSVLGSVSVSLLGESAVAARLPALLFGIATLPALYLLGRRLSSEREALLASVLLATSYHHVWFSQSARGYSAMIFFATAGTRLLVDGVAWNRPAAWRLYVACMTLGVLSLQNTAFVVAGHAGAYLLLLIRKRRLDLLVAPVSRRMAASLVLVGLFSVEGHSLVLFRMLEFFGSVDRTGLGFGFVEFWPVLLGGLRTGLGAVGLAGLVVIVGAGLRSYLKQSPLLAGLLVLPGLFNAGAIVALRYGAYPRSFLYVLPVALLLAVRGISELAGAACRSATRLVAAERCIQRTQSLIAGVLVAGSCVTLAHDYRYPKQDYSGALRYVRSRMAAGDEVAAVGLAAVAYRLRYGPELRFPEDPVQLGGLRSPGHSLWVLFSFPRDMRLRFPAMLDAIDADFKVVARFHGTLGDGDVYVARSDASR